VRRLGWILVSPQIRAFKLQSISVDYNNSSPDAEGRRGIAVVASHQAQAGFGVTRLTQGMDGSLFRAVVDESCVHEGRRPLFPAKSDFANFRHHHYFIRIVGFCLALLMILSHIKMFTLLILRADCRHLSTHCASPRSPRFRELNRFDISGQSTMIRSCRSGSTKQFCSCNKPTCTA
jgi:hypothetical protein